jgi:hypothetical protein
MALEFYPRPQVVSWAKGIIEANPDYEVIIVTHAYLQGNGQRIPDTGVTYGPTTYKLDPATNYSGEELWKNLVKLEPNLKAVICGHILFPHASHSSDMGIKGNTVHQIFINFQLETNGGDGTIGLLKFRQNSATVDVGYYQVGAKKFRADYPSYSLPWPDRAKALRK